MSRTSNLPLDTNETYTNSIFDEWTEKVIDAGNAIRKFAEDTEGNLSVAENRVRTHPLSTCAAIFFSGVLVGVLIRR